MPEILDSRRLPWPVDWAARFGRPAPLWMEIGFGNGQFLVETAAAHPELNVVGVEISQTSLRKAARRADVQPPLPNLALLYGHAQGVLQALFQPGEVEQVIVNFPDPWPKAAHHHRRLISDDFLALLATRQPRGGRLEIATDHADYAAWIESCLARTPYYESRLARPFVTQDRERMQTKYEQIALAEGRTPHYFKWVRNDRAPAVRFPVPRERPMPHIILRCPLTLDELKYHFQPTTVSEEDLVIRFIGLLDALDEQMLVVDTHVEEAPFAQRVGLTIRPRAATPGGLEIIIGLHQLGFPRPTAGIHRAVQALADHLQQLHPEMTVLERSVQD